MTWTEWQLSTQLLAEERIGARMREEAHARRAAEDAAERAALDAMGGI